MRSAELFGYLAKRENVRLRKEAGEPWPWTDDPILQRYKFTNVRREDDATSRKLIEGYYHEHSTFDPRSIILNCAINRYFGRWEFAYARGWINYDLYDPDWLENLAEERRENGLPVFTGAYVITNGGVSAPKEHVVVHYYLAELYDAIPDLVATAQMTRSWEEVAKKMSRISGFGGSGFMTKETLVDTTYTNFWGNVVLAGRPSILSLPRDWWTWSPCGPGARRGVARVLGHDDLESVEARSIRRNAELCSRVMRTLSEESTDRMPFALAPHDIQFALCEFDKYERVRLGQGKPKTTYRRDR